MLLYIIYNLSFAKNATTGTNKISFHYLSIIIGMDSEAVTGQKKQCKSKILSGQPQYKIFKMVADSILSHNMFIKIIY